MLYNNDQLTHKSIIHNLASILWIIEIKNINMLKSNNFKILTILVTNKIYHADFKKINTCNCYKLYRAFSLILI